MLQPLAGHGLRIVPLALVVCMLGAGTGTGEDAPPGATWLAWVTAVRPRLSNAPWTSESNQANSAFGWSVSGAGDVNGDGYDDVIVGAHNYDNGETDEGRAFVFHGSPAGLETSAAWTAEANQAAAAYAWSVSGAGDVNGDGYDDVIVGAHKYDGGETDEGRALVYHGSPTGLDAVAAWTGEADQAGAWFGFSVAAAGDVDADGDTGDVIIGALNYSNGESSEGRVYVYRGSPDGIGTTLPWTGEPDQFGALLGASVAGAGDVNGDGFDDIVAGAPFYSNLRLNEGRVYVYHGSVAGPSSTGFWTAESHQFGANFGSSVGAAGDVDGDGYDDVIVGAPYFRNLQADEGHAFVFHGSDRGLRPEPGWHVESNQSYATMGRAVSGAGDVDGDGYDDVMVGAPAYTSGHQNEGRAFVYHGSPAGLPISPAWTAEPNQRVALFGSSVSDAGDVDGDGYGDVIVGAYGFDNGESGEGRAYVFAGSDEGLPPYFAAAVTGRNGGTNPNSYVAGPAVLGQSWSATVDLTTSGHTHAQIVGHTEGGLAPPLGGGQTPLVMGVRLFALPSRMGPLAGWTVTLPNDPSFCGVTLYTQAIHLSGTLPFALSNAQDLQVGY